MVLRTFCIVQATRDLDSSKWLIPRFRTFEWHFKMAVLLHIGRLSEVGKGTSHALSERFIFRHTEPVQYVSISLTTFDPENSMTTTHLSRTSASASRRVNYRNAAPSAEILTVKLPFQISTQEILNICLWAVSHLRKIPDYQARKHGRTELKKFASSVAFLFFPAYCLRTRTWDGLSG